jgi:hypothetical protein
VSAARRLAAPLLRLVDRRVAEVQRTLRLEAQQTREDVDRAVDEHVAEVGRRLDRLAYDLVTMSRMQQEALSYVGVELRRFSDSAATALERSLEEARAEGTDVLVIVPRATPAPEDCEVLAEHGPWVTLRCKGG